MSIILREHAAKKIGLSFGKRFHKVSAVRSDEEFLPAFGTSFLGADFTQFAVVY